MKIWKIALGVSMVGVIWVPMVWAQPNDTKKTIVAPTDSQQIDKIARDLVNDINSSDMLAAQEKIYGARRGFFGANLWIGEFAASFPFELQVQSVSIPIIDGDTAKATVTYRLEPKKDVPHTRREMRPLVALERSETLQFKLGSVVYEPQRKRWQIVAPDVEPPKPQMKNSYSSLLTYFAFKVAQKPVTEKNLSPQTSLSHLKELGFAVMQFAQDYDDQIAFAPEQLQEALMPYLKNRSLFHVPNSYEPYAFNANLSERFYTYFEGMDMYPQHPWLKNTAKTVLFYEGRGEKPTFRYDGKAAICFADGRVALVSPEEAKNLIWKP